MNIEELKNNYDIINSVDWKMTPEEAISLHLEWGPLRSVSYYNSRDSNNETVYFVIDNWGEFPVVKLIRRRGFDSEELTSFRLPPGLESEFMASLGNHKGIFAVDGNIRDWLQSRLNV
ncbi:MAG: hypothetical protein R6V41_04125 [Desulfobacteraceae bacterium]